MWGERRAAHRCSFAVFICTCLHVLGVSPELLLSPPGRLACDRPRALSQHRGRRLSSLGRARTHAPPACIRDGPARGRSLTRRARRGGREPGRPAVGAPLSQVGRAPASRQLPTTDHADMRPQIALAPGAVSGEESRGHETGSAAAVPPLPPMPPMPRLPPGSGRPGRCDVQDDVRGAPRPTAHGESRPARVLLLAMFWGKRHRHLLCARSRAKRRAHPRLAPRLPLAPLCTAHARRTASSPQQTARNVVRRPNPPSHAATTLRSAHPTSTGELPFM